MTYPDVCTGPKSGVGPLHPQFQFIADFRKIINIPSLLNGFQTKSPKFLLLNLQLMNIIQNKRLDPELESFLVAPIPLFPQISPPCPIPARPLTFTKQRRAQLFQLSQILPRFPLRPSLVNQPILRHRIKVLLRTTWNYTSHPCNDVSLQSFQISLASVMT